jgi:hypothetical protein
MRSRDVLPVPLCSQDASALMNKDSEDHLVASDSCGREEAQEELDQPWIAVDECDMGAVLWRLALRAFTPVGDCADDEDLTIAKVADLSGRSGADHFALGLPNQPLLGPVAPYSLG